MEARRNNGRCFNKGQFGIDLLVWVVVLFVLILVLIVGNNVFSEINTDLQADDDLSNQSKLMLSQAESSYPAWGDNVFIMVLVLFWAFLLISSFFISTNPIYFFIGVVLLVGVLIVGGILSNTYADVAEDSDLSTFEQEFPKASWVMSNLLMVLIVIAMSTMIALYAKGGL